MYINIVVKVVSKYRAKYLTIFYCYLVLVIKFSYLDETAWPIFMNFFVYIL